MKKQRTDSKIGRPQKGELPSCLFGKKLKILQSNKKNHEMESLLGVSSSTYVNYVTGKRHPDSIFLANLAAETGVDLNWLLDDAQGIPEDGKPVFRRCITTPENSAVIDAGLVSKLRAEVEELSASNKALLKALIDAQQEKDKAIEAAKTAGYLRNTNGAAGA